MKKMFLVLTMLLTVLCSTAVQAAAAPAAVAADTLPRVAVLIVNNGKTTYDQNITDHEKEFFRKILPAGRYSYIDGTPYRKKLEDRGLSDLTAAERSDLVDVFGEGGADYIVFMEIEPFERKERKHFMTPSIEMTTQIPFRIIDVARNKYLYKGKFTEKGTNSTMLGGIGSKDAALQAMNQANKKIQAVMAERMPQ